MGSLMKRFVTSYSLVTLIAAAPLFAQDNNAAMADVIPQLRNTADEMEGKLSTEEIAETWRSGIMPIMSRSSRSAILQAHARR